MRVISTTAVSEQKTLIGRRNLVGHSFVVSKLKSSINAINLTAKQSHEVNFLL